LRAWQESRNNLIAAKFTKATVRGRKPAWVAGIAAGSERVAGRSKLARQTLGDAVVDYYVHTARLEQKAWNNSVTDWERQRYFERI